MALRRLGRLAAGLCLSLAAAAAARAEIVTVCTLAEDARTGETLIEEGDCDRRMSPASTFKLALALAGFDAGVLTSPHAPEWPYREGYPAWRAEWRQPADPTRWMRLSVVWYSQQITQRLGEARLQAYLDAFDYGDRDLSGMPGEGPGLTHAWLGSSLHISPREQTAFLRRMLAGELPVRAEAVEMTAILADRGVSEGGWRLHGKTGAAHGRDAAGRRVKGRPLGWFVGWAETDGRAVVFARLVQATSPPSRAPGFIARDGVVADLFGAQGALKAR